LSPALSQLSSEELLFTPIDEIDRTSGAGLLMMQIFKASPVFGERIPAKEAVDRLTFVLTRVTLN
jgi:hypothetical protein